MPVKIAFRATYFLSKRSELKSHQGTCKQIIKFHTNFVKQNKRHSSRTAANLLST